MERRSFLASLFAAAAGLIVKPKPAPVYGGGTVTGMMNLPRRAAPGCYYYEWETGFTTDPQFKDWPFLPYGDANVVTLDGRDVSDLHIFQLQTGPEGYFLYRDNPAEVELYDHVEQRIIPLGDKKYNETLMNTDGTPVWRVRADGEKVPVYRYEERLRQHISRGAVTYRYDAAAERLQIERLREDFEKYTSGLKRYTLLTGISADPISGFGTIAG